MRPREGLPRDGPSSCGRVGGGHDESRWEPISARSTRAGYRPFIAHGFSVLGYSAGEAIGDAREARPRRGENSRSRAEVQPDKPWIVNGRATQPPRIRVHGCIWRERPGLIALGLATGRDANPAEPRGWPAAGLTRRRANSRLCLHMRPSAPGCVGDDPRPASAPRRRRTGGGASPRATELHGKE